MKPTPLFLLACLLLFCQCSSDKAASPEPPDQDPEAYEVYSAILASEGWSSASLLVIRMETEGYPMCLKPSGTSEEILRPAINDYVQKNAAPWTLRPDFQPGKPYELVTSSHLEWLFNHGQVFEGWERFYRQYPGAGGYITLSAVGFNPEKTVAVVFMGFSCGPLCGQGEFHVLQRTGGSWTYLSWLGSRCGWIS